MDDLLKSFLDTGRDPVEWAIAMRDELLRKIKTDQASVEILNNFIRQRTGAGAPEQKKEKLGVLASEFLSKHPHSTDIEIGEGIKDDPRLEEQSGRLMWNLRTALKQYTNLGRIVKHKDGTYSVK